MSRQQLATALYNPIWLDSIQNQSSLSDKALREVLHAERMCFLCFLSQTDFPTLLAWRLPALAQRLFLTAEGVAQHYLQDYKACKQASRVCFGYAVAALPRLGPRQAWVGQGFARFTNTATTTKVNINSQEHLHIEPDLAWFSQHYPALATTPLLAGDDAWDWLARGLHQIGHQAALTYLTSISAQLKILPIGDFQQTLQYQAELQAQLQHLGFATELGQGWWVTRLVHDEIEWPNPILQTTQQAAQHFFTQSLEAQSQSSLPLVQRIAHSYPEHILAPAEEFWNYLVEQDTPIKPRLAQYHQVVKNSALMLEWGNQQLRVLGFDPSPQRSSSRASRLLNKELAFTSNKAFAPLKIPPIILDNRVIRPKCAEYATTELAPYIETEVRTTLMNEAIWSLFLVELGSPRYTVAPDILPLYTNFQQGTVLAFGKLSADAHYLLLYPKALQSLVKLCRNTFGFAQWLKKLNPMFLATEWLDLFIAGKKSCIYTFCALGFDWLFAQFANYTQPYPIIIRIPTEPLTENPIVDTQENSLDTLILIKGLYE